MQAGLVDVEPSRSSWTTSNRAVPLACAALVLLRAIRPRIGRQVPAGTWLHAGLTGPETLLEATTETVRDEGATPCAEHD
ncbi:hypothetical protein JNUCC0626_47260 [Lentzea sp. JNUCC 0626]|uniref:hypothetical protein n=1 Tax=Lentzea sp. JNUCC 0626 TaxID=3367513 RepID=UPI0037487926